MADQSISMLLSEVAKKLVSDFEYKRKTALHQGQKGAEVEDILVDFLNDHLPKRFYSSSAFLIDNADNVSKQVDIAVYDALTSPVYRITDESRIVPADTVAAVIEVKTSLNKAQLADAYEKIASCKALRKSAASESDKAATGSPLASVSTMGIVFAFDSDTTLETLAENAKELNTQYTSNHWPDLIVVLGKGIINYQAQFMGQQGMGAQMVADDQFLIPPAYIHLAVTEDEKLTLNRFFILLLSQLTFFPYRIGTPPFKTAMAGGTKTLMILTSYQYDTNRQLKDVPEELIGSNVAPNGLVMDVFEHGKQIGRMESVRWQDGLVLIWTGSVRLEALRLNIVPEKNIFRFGERQITSPIKMTVDDFAKLAVLLPECSNYDGIVVVTGTSGSQ